MFNMLELVIVVYFTERKNKITAAVFKIPRQKTRLTLFGFMHMADFEATKSEMIKPYRKRKKVTSIAGIDVPVDTNFAKTVAPAKHNSARVRNNIPLRMAFFISRKNTNKYE
jgi:hypothetical protein